MSGNPHPAVGVGHAMIVECVKGRGVQRCSRCGILLTDARSKLACPKLELR